MTYNNNNGASGVTLAELKDRIYKAIGEYSVNGEEIAVTAFEKADMEKSIINAINVSVTKAIQYLPVYTRTLELYFPDIIPLLFKEKIELKLGEQVRFDIKDTAEKAVIRLCYCGNAKVVTSFEDTVLAEHQISCEKNGEIKTSTFVSALPKGTQISITALEGGVYIDSVYCADIVGVCKENEIEHFPKSGKTFAKADAAIQQITYAAKDGKNIPVHNYSYKNGYVYACAEESGKTLIHYTPSPTVFTQNSPEDEMLCLPEITVCAIVYLAASELCPASDADVYNRLTYKYRDIVLNCYDRNKEDRRNSFYTQKKRGIPERGIREWDM